MISSGLRIVGFLTSTYLVTTSVMFTKAQYSSSERLVAIDGLKPWYASCALVSFSVKNTSQQELYVEVYAEKFESGSWNDVDYPYDIKDPKSLYVKRVLINPDMLKPNASILLTYHRCLQPTFVKEEKRAFRKAIIEKDAKADPPILQRLRVDVYVLDERHVKPVQKVLSEPFKRIASEKSAASPVR